MSDRLRCDSCHARRNVTMHPLGVDLCGPCYSRADDSAKEGEGVMDDDGLEFEREADEEFWKVFVTDSPERDLGHWVISGRAILDGLKQAHAGESPDIVYAELYANTSVERVEPDDD